jgi:hypothetical protein
MTGITANEVEVTRKRLDNCDFNIKLANFHIKWGFSKVTPYIVKRTIIKLLNLI